MCHILVISLNNDPISDLGTTHAGGQTKYVTELAKHLLFKNWNVDVLTIGSSHQQKIEEVVPGFRVFRTFRNGKIPYDYTVDAREVETSIPSIISLLEEQANNYVSILACYWLSAVAGVELSKRFEIPLHISFCSLGVFKKEVEDTSAIETRIMTEKRVGQFAMSIIATTRFEKKTLVEQYGINNNNIHVIPRGINPEVFHP